MPLRELIDDEPHHDGTGDVTNDLRAAGWPALEPLLREHPRLFERYVAGMVPHELLDALFAASPRDSAFQLNTLDGVRVDADEIVLTGLGYGKLVS